VRVGRDEEKGHESTHQHALLSFFSEG